MAKPKKKANRTVNVDLSDVESGGLVPEGPIVGTVKEAEVKTSESSGNDYIRWVFSTPKGPVFFNTSLQTQSLFNLRGLLEAFEVEIPDGPMDIDLEEMVGKQCLLHITHEDYEGKTRARVSDYSKLDDEGGDDDDEKAEVKTGKKSGKLKKVDADELEDMEDDELEELIEKYGLDVKPGKTTRKTIAAVKAALEEADLLEE